MADGNHTSSVIQLGHKIFLLKISAPFPKLANFVLLTIFKHQWIRVYVWSWLGWIFLWWKYGLVLDDIIILHFTHSYPAKPRKDECNPNPCLNGANCTGSFYGQLRFKMSSWQCRAQISLLTFLASLITIYFRSDKWLWMYLLRILYWNKLWNRKWFWLITS